MNTRTLASYALSRFFPMDSIPEEPTARTVAELIELGVSDSALDAVPVRDVYPDLTPFDDGGVQDDLCQLWRRYWVDSYRERSLELLKALGVEAS